MTRSRSLLAVTAIFLLGLLAGGFAAHLYYAQSLERRGWRPHQPRRPDLVSRLDQHLGLSADQRTAIEGIMRDSHADADRLRQEMAPRVREHARATHEAILEVLTEEQRPEFEAMMERMEDRAERFFLGPPGGRRGGFRRHGARPPHRGGG